MSLQPNGIKSKDSSESHQRARRPRRLNTRNRPEQERSPQQSGHTEVQRTGDTNGSTTTRETVSEARNTATSMSSISLGDVPRADSQSGAQAMENDLDHCQSAAPETSPPMAPVASAQLLSDQRSRTTNRTQSVALQAWSTSPISEDAWSPLSSRSRQ